MAADPLDPTLLRRQNRQQFLADILRNARGLGQATRAVVQPMIGDIPAGLAGLGSMMLTGNMEKAAAATRGVQDQFAYAPTSTEGEEYIAGLARGIEAAGEQVGRVPGAKRAGAAIGRGWDALVNLSPATAATLAGVAAVADPTKGGGKAARAVKSVERAFEGVADPAVARAIALRGGHLKKSKTGKYIGAPATMDSPAKLGAARREADRLVEAGAPYRNWYDEERAAIADLTDRPDMQSLAARGGAVYSAQAKPSTEGGFFFKQHNEATLGQKAPPKVRTAAQQKNIARAYKDYPTTGTLAPEEIRLGPKTEPYAEGKDPTVDQEQLWKTANDIRQGRVWGYDEGANSPFSRGFTGAEHGFLTGENLRLAERAATRDALRGVTRDKPWNVLRAQASTWVALAAEANIAKALASAKKAGRTPDMQKITEKAWRDASDSLPRSIVRNSLVLTEEARPGAGVRHLTMGNDEGALVGDYTQRVMAARGGRNPVLTALDQYAGRDIPTQGRYPNSQGVMEDNPGFANRYAVGTDMPKTDIPRTSASSKAAASAATDVGAFLRAQEAGAHSRFIPQGMGKQRVEQMSGVEMSTAGRSPEEVRAILDALRERGIDSASHGDTVLLYKLGELPGGDFGPLPGSTGEIIKALPKGTEARRGIAETYYQPTGLTGEEGAGTATEQLLSRFSQYGDQIPGLEERTATAIANEAKAMNILDDAVAAETGKAQRADLRRAREIMARGGMPALRRYVEEYGSKGLPAALLGVLGLSAAGQGGEPTL